MLSPARIAVIIPCFNEARFIKPLVQEILPIIPNIIVVDDHSLDQTALLAKESGAVVLTNDQQMGKGGSLLRGLKFAADKGYQWALLMDGDGQHSPEDIARFLAVSENVGMVVGNRMHSCEKMPWLRRTINRVMSKLISELADSQVPDTQCGFRLLNLTAWRALDLQSQRFEIESEMVVAFAAAGYSIQHVPIQVIYRNEQSKIRPCSDTIRWLKWYFNTRQKLGSMNSTPALAGKVQQTSR